MSALPPKADIAESDCRVNNRHQFGLDRQGVLHVVRLHRATNALECELANRLDHSRIPGSTAIKP
jgi:hypothetical protein